jgi:folate-binding protein YgfZ
MNGPISVSHAPTLGEVGGRSVVLSYAGLTNEYEALRRHAIAIDRSYRTRLRLTGERAGEMLTGLVTNDVLALAAGQGQYAAALTAKGKIVADVRIFADDGSYLVDCSPRAGDAWVATIKKFINPKLAPYQDESATLRDLGVFGIAARHVVAEMTGASGSALGTLAPYGHMTASVDGARVLVARVPELEVEGFELFAPAEAFQNLWDRAIAARAIPAGLTAWEIARVEAGRPEWGIDIDESTLAQEANLDELHAISYTKGCYVGQETVARVHFRGHVNRFLRGLRSASEVPPLSGAALFDMEGREVGDVRSAVSSPRFGGIAIAMVRREVETGAPLVARWNGELAGAEGVAGESFVDVTPLPFFPLSVT